MTSYEGCTSFLNLPLELREQIYGDVVLSHSDGTRLLRTCHEIHNEAQKFLYQKAVTFRSQQDLYTWLDTESHRKFLIHVKEVILEIQDVDLDALLRPHGDYYGSTPRLRAFEIYKSDLGRLRQAFAKISNVEILTIRALMDQHSFLYAKYLTEFLGLIGTLTPNLVNLRLEGNFHYQDLGFMTSLNQLTSFSFDGFSSTSPTNTADILTRMRCLTRLSLVSQGSFNVPDYLGHQNLPIKHQSITGEVIQTMKRLHSFSVAEHIPCSSPELFFTADLLRSLHGLLHLNSLSVTISHTPDHETLTSLGGFLEESSIQRLELDWPELNPLILKTYDLLTKDLQVLWIRAKSAADAFKILHHVKETRELEGVQNLRQVVLVRSIEYQEIVQNTTSRKDSGVESIEEAPSVSTAPDKCERSKDGSKTVESLRSLCIKVAWCTEDS